MLPTTGGFGTSRSGRVDVVRANPAVAGAVAVVAVDAFGSSAGTTVTRRSVVGGGGGDIFKFRDAVWDSTQRPTDRRRAKSARMHACSVGMHACMRADTFTRREEERHRHGPREETGDETETETETETDRVVRGVRDEETRDGVVRDDAWERCVDCVGADNSMGCEFHSCVES